MDVPEDKYRKIISQFKGSFTNILNEYPITAKSQRNHRWRNLDYMVSRAVLGSNLPYYNPLYEETMEEIKGSLSENTNPQVKALALRLARSLPLLHRIQLIERYQNEITGAILESGKSKEQGGHPYGYQSSADGSDLLLSVLLLTSQSEDIYFDVNQRIITIFSRYFEYAFTSEKHAFRNGCEVLRCILNTFGGFTQGQQTTENKLISKLINNFLPPSSFVSRPESDLSSQLGPNYRPKNNSKLQQLVFRTREFEARLRGRLLYGFCGLVSYLLRADYEMMDILQGQIFTVLENISECDVNLECFGCLRLLVSQVQDYSTRNSLLKRWFAIVVELPFKKQYLPYYIFLLETVARIDYAVPHRIRYSLAMHCLELTKHVQSQYTRFLLYHGCCFNMVAVSRLAYRTQGTRALIKIFQYSWLIDRINQENDLFKSEVLITMLHAFAECGQSKSREQTVDMMDICIALIDWKCTSKEQTHIPTVKMAFDMYLTFLSRAARLLQKDMQPHIVDLINRCNEPSIYYMFKFKLICTVLQFEWYQNNHKYLQGSKINFEFIQEQVRAVMMPKNPKPIFLYEYSLTYDGEIESRKELEYIKIIMKLLGQIAKVHQERLSQIDTIVADYHRYLSDLEMRDDANKELINCLQTLQADYYFNECQRYFLLTAMGQGRGLSVNFETNLEDNVLFSPWESIYCEDEVNIFGPMSPVQLTISLHPHPTYQAVYIHIKKNQWVQTAQELKLKVSSGIEKKEVPFESSILEIQIDRIGSLHFQVWKGTQNDLLLGSGNFRIKRKLCWRRVDHLNMIDGIRTKAYFKEEGGDCGPETFLSYYYGEPLMVHINRKENEVIFGVSSKEIWYQLRELMGGFVQQLTSGSADILPNQY